MNQQLEVLKSSVQGIREKLLSHPIYNRINDLQGLTRFAEYHVFAVWDFMSLLKSLQIQLTAVSIPWMPKGTANTRYLINEIVTGEESDIDENGKRISHFELYLSAMKQMGTSAYLLDQLFANIEPGLPMQDAIRRSQLPAQIKEFLQFTFYIIEETPIYVQAAVFTFGREDLIPDLFMRILEKIHADHPEKTAIFTYYIQRHIEVDGGHHGQLALEMVETLCGGDDLKWKQATEASVKALEKRCRLWDGILQHLDEPSFQAQRGMAGILSV